MASNSYFSLAVLFLAALGFGLAPLVLAVGLGLCLLAVRWLSKLGGAQRRTAPGWLCGYARESEMHRCRAHGLFGEVKRMFPWVGGKPRPQPEPTSTPLVSSSHSTPT